MHLFHPHLWVEVRFLLPQPQWVSVSAQHTNHFLCLLAKPIRRQNRHGFTSTTFSNRTWKKMFETKSSLICVSCFSYKLFWQPRMAHRCYDRQFIIYACVCEWFLYKRSWMFVTVHCMKTSLCDSEAWTSPWTLTCWYLRHFVGLRFSNVFVAQTITDGSL